MFSKISISRMFSVLLVVVMISGSAAAHPLNAPPPLGTGFTYQGRLSEGGSPANGVYRFQFKLFDDLTGGVQKGSTLTFYDQTVTNGLFTISLDFGNEFDGTPLFLEVSVGVLEAGSYVFIPLTPRQALTPTPYAIYAEKAPWSGLTGVPAGFADGVDNGSSYQNVKVVAKSGGDFTSIQAALDSITDASTSNRYLVWVAPGVYNERVTMKPFVDIEGAGELTTRITYTGSASWATGTLVGASDAELRFLTVENTGGNTYATAIDNNSAQPRLTHVTASASGGTNNYGVYNNTSSPVMTDVTASASGGMYSYGVNNSSSSPAMTGVTASASGGTLDNYGVWNDASSPTMTNVTASASGGTYNTGIMNNNSSPTINNSVISASGGGANVGIYNNASSGTYTVLVNNSQISGTNTILNDTEFTTRVGASQLSGGAVSAGGGTLTCAGVYDEAYTFYASTCP